MVKKFHAAALPAVLAAAAIIINTACVLPLPAEAEEASGWETISPTEEASDSVTAVPESEGAYIAAEPEEDSGIRREKYYLLQAMDKLEDMGASPIALWAKVTGNEKVIDTVRQIGRSAADAVTDTVSEKVSEAGEAVSEKVQEAGSAAAEQAKSVVQEQTEQAKKSLLERLKEWIRDTLGSGKEQNE